MALLDPDRYEGRFRHDEHTADAGDLMCRRIKEELLTFEGRPLFPERRASTVPYDLSPLERELYEAVTHYVRTEMNRAEQLRQAGEGRRGNTVGFALTVLQDIAPEVLLKRLVSLEHHAGPRLASARQASFWRCQLWLCSSSIRRAASGPAGKSSPASSLSGKVATCLSSCSAHTGGSGCASCSSCTTIRARASGCQPGSASAGGSRTLASAALGR